MALSITIDLPADIEQRLRHDTPDLAADAREAYAVDLYRRERITAAELGLALGIHRMSVDAVLKKHGVMLELSEDEFALDLADLRANFRK